MTPVDKNCSVYKTLLDAIALCCTVSDERPAILIKCPPKQRHLVHQRFSITHCAALPETGVALTSIQQFAPGTHSHISAACFPNAPPGVAPLPISLSDSLSFFFGKTMLTTLAVFSNTFTVYPCGISIPSSFRVAVALLSILCLSWSSLQHLAISTPIFLLCSPATHSVVG